VVGDLQMSVGSLCTLAFDLCT